MIRERDQRELTAVGIISGCVVFGAGTSLLSAPAVPAVKGNAGFGAAKQVPQGEGPFGSMVL